MIEASYAGNKGVVGYEANGGFLTDLDFPMFGKELRALPKRDAVLPVQSIILLSIKERKSIWLIFRNASPSRPNSEFSRRSELKNSGAYHGCRVG